MHWHYPLALAAPFGCLLALLGLRTVAGAVRMVGGIPCETELTSGSLTQFGFRQSRLSLRRAIGAKVLLAVQAERT